MRHALLLAAALGVAGCSGHAGTSVEKPAAGDPTTPGVTMTLYDGWAIVEDRRRIELPAGDGEVRFDGVPSLIDTSSVTIAGSSAKPPTFSEQELVPGQPTTAELITHSIGKQVTIGTAHGDIKGTLLAASSNALVVETEGGVRMVPLEGVSALSVDGKTPYGGRPALRWRVASSDKHSELVTATYRAMGLSWNASYAFVIDEEGERTDVSAWITIVNGSGGEFKDARIRLTTPTPVLTPIEQRAQPANGDAFGNGYGTLGNQQRIQNPNARNVNAVVAIDEQAPPPPVRPVQPTMNPPRAAENHSYWLNVPETVRAGGTTQIAYVPRAVAVPSRKVLVFDPIGAEGVWRGATVVTDPSFDKTSTAGVAEYEELENVEAVGLGKALPAGSARIFVRDEGGKLRFTGTSSLEHVGAGERIRLKMGSSTDVMGTRTQTDFALDTVNKRMVEEIEVVIENKAKTPRDVVVLERLARGDSWVISWTSLSEDEIEKDDARTIRVPMSLKPAEKRTFRYRVVYTW